MPFLRVTFLIITLAFMQIVPLHMHVYDHEHGTQNHESFAEGHAHLNQIHLSHDSLDASHSHEVVSEVDIGWEGLLKSFSFGSLVVFILIAVIIVFLAAQLYVYISWRRTKDAPSVSQYRTFFTPLLRAPPF